MVPDRCRRREGDGGGRIKRGDGGHSEAWGHAEKSQPEMESSKAA